MYLKIDLLILPLERKLFIKEIKKSLQDTYRHKGLRRRLVEELQNMGIQDKQVLQAIATVPRHFFFEKTFVQFAYENAAYPIDKDQTISQPYTVAFQTILLQVKKREKILEIGTGSGYQAAILGILGARVYSVERIKSLYETAKILFEDLGMRNVRNYYRDGHKGLGEFAPFDKILVTAAAKDIPIKLLDQLKIGGFLVIPVGKGRKQQMFRLQKTSEENDFIEENFGVFSFVPMLDGREI